MIVQQNDRIVKARFPVKTCSVDKKPRTFYSGGVEILILCKVVDNYGDIGFVYRLARALSDVDGSLRLTLAVSDLSSFAYMAPGLDAALPYQRYCGWEVLDWNDFESCARWCREYRPLVVLECFQCGRPDWLEDYLFGGGLPDGRTAHVINLEYLTAEDWAEDFHLLKSGTRSARVRKVNFMPGFTAGTGGLLLDRPFLKLLDDRPGAVGKLRAFLPAFNPAACTVLVFSYEKDFVPFVRAFERFHAEDGKLSVFLAPGRGASSFKSAYSFAGCGFPLTELPRLPQDEWDALLASCGVLLVRGEESFSRACLSGRPFVWHAYRQDGAFQLVKIAALLERMREFFLPEDFSLLAELFLLYNCDTDGCPDGSCGDASMGAEALEAVSSLCPDLLPHLGDGDFAGRRLEELAYGFLSGQERLAPGFRGFSLSLRANGDLAARLLGYIQESCV